MSGNFPEIDLCASTNLPRPICPEEVDWQAALPRLPDAAPPTITPAMSLGQLEAFGKLLATFGQITDARRVQENFSSSPDLISVTAGAFGTARQRAEAAGDNAIEEEIRGHIITAEILGIVPVAATGQIGDTFSHPEVVRTYNGLADSFLGPENAKARRKEQARVQQKIIKLSAKHADPQESLFDAA